MQLEYYTATQILEVCNKAKSLVSDNARTTTASFQNGYNSGLADIARIIEVNLGSTENQVEAITRFIELNNVRN